MRITHTLSIFLFSLALVPMAVFAQNNNAPATDAQGNVIPRAIVVSENNQANAAANGTNSTGGGGSISGSAGNAASCALASGLSNLVQSSISSGLSSMLETSEVPTSNDALEGKETGTITSAGISWDSLGFCLINSIIHYIGTATVNWINSGFNGSPAYIDDPEAFFTGIADIEAGNFLNEVSNGFLCTPIKNIVKIRLANNYNANGSGRNQNQCTFTGVSGNIEKFMSGESFSWDDWVSYTQVPQNNPFGATIYGQIELDARLAKTLGVQSKLLDWGRGFFSFKDPETGKISSPGSIIEGQLNSRFFSGEQRLNVADEFDEVVTALVNQLVKIAVNEVTGAVRN